MNNIDNGTGTKESRLKIIRNESIGSYSWDSSSENDGYGINEWSQADIKNELNTLYLNRQSGTCYNGENNATTTCDFTSIGLTEEAKNMISNAMWHTGTVDGSTNTYNNTNAATFYTSERSSNTGKICTGGVLCDDEVIRTTTWSGLVGLMYPSDYGYATNGGSTTDRTTCLTIELYNWNNYSDCYNNDWLNISDDNVWTITPSVLSNNANRVLYIGGGRINHIYAMVQKMIYPTVYLSSSIVISNGKGTEENPYTLRI